MQLEPVQGSVRTSLDDADDSWFWVASNGANGNGRRRQSNGPDFYLHEGLANGTEFAFEITTVPEPAALGLLALPLSGALAVRRLRGAQGSIPL